MPEPTIEVTVTRQEPGGPPREETFEVPYGERSSVLDLLDAIKEREDPSLTYRWSCRSGVCGSCGVSVNGSPRLACETGAAGYRASGIRLAPLAGVAVERDLVTSPADFVSKLRSVLPWLIDDAGAGAGAGEVAAGSSAPAPLGSMEPGPPASDSLASGTLASGQAAPTTQSPAELSAFADFTACVNCLLCYAACPVVKEMPEFVGPAAIAIARRWDLDSRDHGAQQRAPFLLETEFAIWPCIQDGSCTIACPKGVDPARALRDYQREAMG
ncbi:MAG: 2Fe-2S iron-sulfur cluster-binding protein [Promicromonosporaceae bacterium]|nr:2Fe-2S iron-sulfur cluster-binding protein [Promicromonosporaceae bacterium]